LAWLNQPVHPREVPFISRTLNIPWTAGIFPPAVPVDASHTNEELASALVFERQDLMGAGWAHRWVRENRSRVVDVAEMADDSKWSGTNEAYNSSASFLAFLLDRYGAAALKQIYHARSPEIARRVQEVYGKSLAALEAEWLAAT